jgi:mannose-6-phosphate isomerase-like protein (cupin superfamily)
LSAIAVPDVWSDYSKDVIDVVVKGRGELIAVNNTTKIREGDAFVIPFGIEYQVRNSDGKPLVLLSSKLEA